MVSKEYQCILFSIAIFWLLIFKLHNLYYARKGIDLDVERSPHATNRWLKGNFLSIFEVSVLISINIYCARKSTQVGRGLKPDVTAAMMVNSSFFFQE